LFQRRDKRKKSELGFMQGKKTYSEKLFTSFQLSDRIPEENFYRRLKDATDFRFMRAMTSAYYGDCGQKSIDPEVFMKIMLVGYLENISSDRQLLNHCALRMDILYFLGYDIDEPLPWHSTLSRTRALLPDDVFSQAFEQVLSMCVAKGMVGGRTQAIDSAPIKANASMDSLELKVPTEELEEHLRRVRAMSEVDKRPKKEDQDDGDNHPKGGPSRKAKNNKASQAQQQVTARKDELQELAARNKKWATEQTERPGAKHNQSKYTSNKTHYSPVDPDARISVKPGKARKLNYHAQMAVDTDHHVITHIGADFADKVDSLSLQQIVKTLQPRLRKEHLIWRNLAADAGYSSGENYAFLEQVGLESYIPPHGTYKGGPEGFTYHKEGDYWECSQGAHVTFRKIQVEKSGNRKRLYMSKRSQCKGCPIKAQCLHKTHERRITITAYREEYEHAIERVNSNYGKYLKRRRSATVEPVFGTLTQFMGLRKINTRGISNANKCMLVAAMAYNRKKYLKFTKNKAESVAQVAHKTVLEIMDEIRLILSPNLTFNF
jgi:transposase